MTFHRRAFVAAGLVAAAAPVALAQNGDRSTIEAFYNEYLSAAGPQDKAAVATRILAADWKSYGDYSGKANTPQGLTAMLGGFHKLMPDLTWKIEDILQSGNRYVVRGRATGTPKGPLFGVDGQGRSFTIMSIDIHTVTDGKITESYHVEDWSGALRQLSGK